MKLIDLVKIIKGEVRINLYDSGVDVPICFTKNTWRGVMPYYQREVISMEFTTDVRSMQSDIDIVLAKKTCGIKCDTLVIDEFVGDPELDKLLQDNGVNLPEKHITWESENETR